MIDSYKEEIIDFYKVRGTAELGIEIENSVQSVGWAKEPEQGWSREEAQRKRFEVLYDIGASKDSTIIDYGCGLGHMIDFLKDKGHNTQEQYLGVDILEEFVNTAKKIYPGHRFITGDIYDVEGSYDYVLASGAFTIRATKERMLKAISYALRVANKGVAFNLLHEKHLLSVNDNFQTYNPEILLDELKRFYDNVDIVNNYLPDKDFTIYIKK
jgi:SAM-dependent methyltransferase